MPFLREPSHILLLLIVIIVLFGAKRLPDSARSLGRSLRIFKSEMKDMKNDDKNENKDDTDGSAAR
ncbi:MAG: twin-arginine translocase TatA/TatE family subunit [Actinobacteria bacterium]|nr:twin-arginine translocase TatA/TatE family subunit [Actinomycetota bacterium]